jgi:hypothetical protein
LTHKSMEAMRTMKRKVMETKRIEEGRQIPDEERAANAVVASLTQHVAQQLEDLSAELNAGGSLNSIVSRDHALRPEAFLPSSRRDFFSTIFKWQLSLQSARCQSASVLTFLLCVKDMGGGEVHGSREAERAQQKDPLLWFVPVFQCISLDRLEERTKIIGYFKKASTSPDLDLTRPADLQVPSGAKRCVRRREQPVFCVSGFPMARRRRRNHQDHDQSVRDIPHHRIQLTVRPMTRRASRRAHSKPKTGPPDK